MSDPISRAVASGAAGGGPPPTINSYYASSYNTYQGQSVTLYWTTTNATSASISPTVGTVATSGSVTVDHSQINNQTTINYVLTATNANGSTTATVSIAHCPFQQSWGWC